MSNITKSPSVNNYQHTATNHTSSVKSHYTVSQIHGKGENHLQPDHSSGNREFILDHFYSNAHNLQASYHRLVNSGDKHSLRQFYKQHEEEVFSGALDLIDAINELIKSSENCDQQHLSHFKFLIESILNDFEDELHAIGITHKKHQFTVNRYTFFNMLCDHPEAFEFLFKIPKGLIEQLSSIHLKIQNISDRSSEVGMIIDFKA